MRTIYLSLILAFALPALSSISWAVPLTIDPLNSTTSFVAIGRPAMLRIHGESKNLKSHLDLEKQILNGELSMPLADFKTGIELRDEHMKKKYLEIERFPEAILKIKDLQIPVLKDGESRELKFTAEMSLHGITHSIDVITQIKMIQSRFDIHAQSNFKLSDFKIDVPTYAGIKVADLVELDIQFRTK
jgi:polyisoprenoid-binding protein YceI